MPCQNPSLCLWHPRTEPIMSLLHKKPGGEGGNNSVSIRLRVNFRSCWLQRGLAGRVSRCTTTRPAHSYGILSLWHVETKLRTAGRCHRIWTGSGAAGEGPLPFRHDTFPLSATGIFPIVRFAYRIGDRCSARRTRRSTGPRVCRRGRFGRRQGRVDPASVDRLGLRRHDPAPSTADRQTPARAIWPWRRTPCPAD